MSGFSNFHPFRQINSNIGGNLNDYNLLKTINRSSENTSTSFSDYKVPDGIKSLIFIITAGGYHYGYTEDNVTQKPNYIISKNGLPQTTISVTSPKPGGQPSAGGGISIFNVKPNDVITLTASGCHPLLNGEIRIYGK